VCVRVSCVCGRTNRIIMDYLRQIEEDLSTLAQDAKKYVRDVNHSLCNAMHRFVYLSVCADLRHQI
jgi:hypothetical protein